MKSSINPISIGQLHHVGVAVKDVDKTIEFLSQTLGLGPWQVLEICYVGDTVKIGKAPFRFKLAFAELGPIQLELVQPIEGRSVQSQFLETWGEGLHHIGFQVPNVDQVVSRLQELGVGVVQSVVSERGNYTHVVVSGGIDLEFIQAFPNGTKPEKK